jgi:hypothetical protein
MGGKVKKAGGQGFGQHERAEDYSDVWLTPHRYVLPLGEFDLDPCAWEPRPLPNCREHYFKLGVEREWRGRVWMNAPYSLLEPFVRKFWRHEGGGVALTFLRAETDLFMNVVWRHAKGLLIPAKRIPFIRGDGSESTNSAGTASVYFTFTERDARVLRECSIPGVYIDGAGIERKFSRLTLF